MAHPEGPQPPPNRPRRRQPRQSAQPQHHRIAVEVAQVPQAAATADQQREHHHDHPRHAEVGAGQCRPEQLPQPRTHAARPEIPTEEFQPRVRRQPLVRESQAEIPIDPPPQIRSSSSHWEWPFVVVDVGCSQHPLYHNERPSQYVAPAPPSIFSVTSRLTVSQMTSLAERSVPNSSQLEPAPRVAAGDGLVAAGRSGVIERLQCNHALKQRIAYSRHYPAGLEPVADVARAYPCARRRVEFE